ncbi:fused MFS/spermidine synthase, partial [Streptomyces yerevanensis]|uniref:fused MFS/spermidine synthase n=1 Tax=Streptomyces yerevanensis TaxID=66378 RepID=UPI00146FC95D
MPPLAAAILVFASSGAVLILETLAIRLLAPYIGINLQVNSAVIGTALASIALGTWLGGRIADRISPRSVIGWLLLTGGVTVLLVLPTVRLAGRTLNGTHPIAVIALASVAVFLPAALLSAVSPLVVKLQLNDLHRTGSIVGRLSSLGTLGGIVATFLTGFVLVATMATSLILMLLGSLLVAGGVVCVFALRRIRSYRTVAVAAALGLGATGLTATAPKVCDAETEYNCANIEPLAGA